MQELVWSPSDFVAVLNQTLEFAYPFVSIEGELANFRVSRGKWVYFDIKDETASVRCFGTVFMLPGPLEDGMMVRLTAQPRLHPLYNFSLNIQSIVPVGEGSLKRAADLLYAKLEKEGLFADERKRLLPYAPIHVGLVTSQESAAYADFIKILNARWGGVRISHVDVQVQGEQAVSDVVQAIELLNQLGDEPEVLVIVRGGGSAEDLAAFSSEQVTRAVAASRIPTLVAIGHEIDLTLAELAADRRASTPSNAAELLVPDKKEQLIVLKNRKQNLLEILTAHLYQTEQIITHHNRLLTEAMSTALHMAEHTLKRQRVLLDVLSPTAALKRGYAIVRRGEQVIKSARLIGTGDQLKIQLQDGTIHVAANRVE